MDEKLLEEIAVRIVQKVRDTIPEHPSSSVAVEYVKSEIEAVWKDATRSAVE